MHTSHASLTARSFSRPGRALLGVAALLVASGCGGGGGQSLISYVCAPACPAGTHCTETGCVLDSSGGPDVGGPADLAMGCVPACSGATPICNPQSLCVACLVDGDCPTGSVCKQSGATTACVPGCNDDPRCGGGPMKCCGAQCIDTSSDASNCGACGMVCVGNNAATSCVASACQSGACDTGWGDCNADPGDGCETNLRVDTKNCGACKSTCAFPNATAGCASACYIEACQFGFDDCNSKPEDGCETKVSADNRNCGACGNACAPPPHATSACINAACVLASCQGLWMDCDANPQNGCETDGNGDNKNCGACGNSCGQGLICKGGGCTCPQCNIPNAASKCVNNVCILDKCNPGFADCDGDPGNGCEVDITSDDKNCGGCAMPCPMNMNVCFQSACTDVPKVSFFNSMPVQTGMTNRGAGDSCGTQIVVGNADVLVRAIAVSNSLNANGNIKFMIWDHGNKSLVYVSNPKAFNAGAGWKQSDPFAFTLVAGKGYDIGGIADQGATWHYDTVTENMGGVRSLSANPNWTNFANPVFGGNAGADCGIQLY